MRTLKVSDSQKGIIVGCPKCGNVFDISITKIASELGSLGGLRRKANLTDKERSSQASQAAKARWANRDIGSLGPSGSISPVAPWGTKSLNKMYDKLLKVKKTK